MLITRTNAAAAAPVLAKVLLPAMLDAVLHCAASILALRASADGPLLAV